MNQHYNGDYLLTGEHFNARQRRRPNTILDVCLDDALLDHLYAVQAVQGVESRKAKGRALNVIVGGQFFLLS